MICTSSGSTGQLHISDELLFYNDSSNENEFLSNRLMLLTITRFTISIEPVARPTETLIVSRNVPAEMFTVHVR